MIRLVIFIFISNFSNIVFGQKGVEILHKGQNTSLRGLSVVSDQVFWVSGSNGTVGRSIDGGKNIDWHQVKGFEKSDFRDIEAFDENTALIMAIAEPAYILKTTDGGKNWKTVYQNNTKGMFLDAMDFGPPTINGRKGMVVGDAVNGKIFLAKTENGGDSWQEIEQKPASIGQEGCFASSGTNIVIHKNDYYFVTGGINSRFFKNGIPSQIPIIQGLETTGANSIAISANGKNIIIVGGDFNKKESQTDNCLISKNGGKTFKKSKMNPAGYRSCVEFVSKKIALSCGLNGVDITTDKGLNWLNISTEGFHVCQKSKSKKVIFLAGGNGKIGKITFSRAVH